MYVIVDWHDCTATANATNASAFFKTIATSYHTYPNILYEPWNEPSASGGPSWSGVIKPYMETVIGAIRAIDPNNIVICGNPQWDQLPQNAAADPITDYKNIAYSMHFYSGSHSESGFGPGISTAMSKGCAIFITEYGTCNATEASPPNLPESRRGTISLMRIISVPRTGELSGRTSGAAAFQRAPAQPVPGPLPILPMMVHS